MWDRRRALASATGSSRGSCRSSPKGRASGSLGGPQQSSVTGSAAAAAAASRPRQAAASHYTNNKHRARRPSHNSNHKAYSLSSSYSRSQLDVELDLSLSALGITTDVTHKYRILKGKTVPQSLYPEDSYSSLLDYYGGVVSSPVPKPPPRNPRRLQQLRHQTVFAPTRSSSIYSVDDSDPSEDASPTTISRGAAAFEMVQPLAIQPVSPPSSPEIKAWRTTSHADNVSPIDEDSDASLEHFVHAIKGSHRDLTPPLDSLHYSQIPAAQRDLPAASRHGPHHAPRIGHAPAHQRAPAHQQAPAHQRAPAQRKPVNDENAQWRPQPQPPRSAPRGQMQRPPQQAMIPERDSSFGVRSKRVDGRAMALEIRPPWHGASGREQQVGAMRDDPNVSPLTLPAKSGKRTAAKGESHFRARLSQIGSPRTDGNSGPGAAMRKLISSRTHKKTNSLAAQSPRTQYNSYASPPDHSPYPSPPHQDQYRMAETSPQPQHSPGQGMAIKRKPPGAHVHRNSNHAHPLASSPVNEDDMPKPSTPESPTAPHNAHGDAWTQPGSRFSITTYATTADGLTSIENSPAINMESPSLAISSLGGPVSKNEHLRSVHVAPLATRDGLIFRPDSATSDKTVNRSTGSGSGVTATPRRSSLSSMSKPLPPAPPEVSAGDRVAHLEAQIESLANRRANINRSIKQMTELMPTDNLLNSDRVQKKRELERKKVDGLKVELAEIQREEHELGMKLHRAYKRRNKEAEFEPTTLWVSRVAA